MASNNPNSPRQKMINLMYLVFIAMLALNVSSEVLDGFDLVEDGLQQTIKSIDQRNDLVISEINTLYNANRTKAGASYNSAHDFIHQSDSLYAQIAQLKTLIVKESDGEGGDVNNIKHKDDLNAASAVMLSPTTGRAEKLKKEIEVYRTLATSLVVDDAKKAAIEDVLSTKPSRQAKDGKNWEESLFEQMPTSAAITLLTKIQSDVRSTQGEVLTDLLASINRKDIRIRTLTASVVPDAMIVMAGGKFSGKVVLTATDPTINPPVYINNNALDSTSRGVFSFPVNGQGKKTLNGYVKWGEQQYDFSTTYTVVPPVASIEIANTNVLYTSYPNTLTISVPGVPSDRISAHMDAASGTITQDKTKGVWIAKPAKAGKNITITVVADGRTILKEYRVRPLPDPIAFIDYTVADGGLRRFKGGAIDKSIIVGAAGVKAAIDDGVLNIAYEVVSFRTIFMDGMGNSIPEISNGANFSDRQKEQIRKLGKGKSFFIADVKAKGIDGAHDISTAMQVKIK